MTDTAPAIDPWYFDYMGRAALDLKTRPRPKLTIHDGGRRMLGDRTPRPALELKIVEKENQQ
jgi:hypothetical protein